MFYRLRFFIVLSLTQFIVGCEIDQGRHELSGSTMGTAWNLSYYAPSGDSSFDPEVVRLKIENRLLYLNDILSNYVHDSEINRLNALPSGKYTSISHELIEVFKVAQRISKLTNGIYDISISPLVELWGFGLSLPPIDIPSVEKISAKRLLVGLDSIVIDEENKTILKSRVRSFDLSSLGKGYAVDVVSDDLKNIGLSNFLFEIGGEIFASGSPADDRPWQVAVRSPLPNSSGILKIFSLSGVAVATSGDYQNFFEHQNIRYSHIIDPITGFPVQRDLVSATVISNSAMIADAFATALILLGSEKAIGLANQMNLAVYLIKKDDEKYIELMSSKLLNYLES